MSRSGHSGAQATYPFRIRVNIVGNEGAGTRSLLDFYQNHSGMTTPMAGEAREGDPTFTATLPASEDTQGHVIHFTLSDRNAFTRAFRTVRRNTNDIHQATIIVVDPTNMAAYGESSEQYSSGLFNENLETRLNRILQNDDPNNVVTLVITKCDLAHPHDTDTEENKAFKKALNDNIRQLSKIASQKNIPVFQTSTETQFAISNVGPAFEATAKNYLASYKYREQQEQAPATPPTPPSFWTRRSSTSQTAAARNEPSKEILKLGRVENIKREPTFASGGYANLSNPRAITITREINRLISELIRLQPNGDEAEQTRATLEQAATEGKIFEETQNISLANRTDLRHAIALTEVTTSYHITNKLLDQCNAIAEPGNDLITALDSCLAATNLSLGSLLGNSRGIPTRDPLKTIYKMTHNTRQYLNERQSQARQAAAARTPPVAAAAIAGPAAAPSSATSSAATARRTTETPQVKILAIGSKGAGMLSLLKEYYSLTSNNGRTRCFSTNLTSLAVTVPESRNGCDRIKFTIKRNSVTPNVRCQGVGETAALTHPQQAIIFVIEAEDTNGCGHLKSWLQKYKGRNAEHSNTVFTLIITKCDIKSRVAEKNITELLSAANKEKIVAYQVTTQGESARDSIIDAFEETAIRCRNPQELHYRLENGADAAAAPATPPSEAIAGPAADVIELQNADAEDALFHEQMEQARLASLEQSDPASVAAAIDAGAFSAAAPVTPPEPALKEVMYTDEDGNDYDEEPTVELCCPITHALMQTPSVLAETGMTYEQSSIVRWLSNNNTDPLTGAAIANKKHSINFFAKNIIEKWKKEHLIERPKSAAAPGPR